MIPARPFGEREMMDTGDILRIRLHSQLIEGSTARAPRDVVSHLLAMQAQDYAGATWAIGLRLPGSSLADVERAIADRSIVRTWPMRGTLHFLAAEDVRWMVALLAPRTLARAAARERQLGLDGATFERARDAFEAALAGDRRLTRPDAMAMLESHGIETSGQRGYHVLWRLAQEGLIVVGPMEGRQQTFALLDDWVPPGAEPPPTRESALATLARRYFTGHGPATLDDLARWAGLPKSEARAAIDAVAGTLASGEHEGVRYWYAPDAPVAAAVAPGSSRSAAGPRVHLLPGFDEYMLGYTGRSHQLGENLGAYGARVASNGMLAPTVIVDGKAVATWKRRIRARSVAFDVAPFAPLSEPVEAALAIEQDRCARFLGR